MILEQLDVAPADLRAATGWDIKPEGACKGDRCVPLGHAPGSDTFDVRLLAEKLGMPLVHDDEHGLWSLGPESGGRVLDTADFPDLSLPDLDGIYFDLGSLRGQKVLLVAWASW